MAAMLEGLMAQLQGGHMPALSKAVGADEATTQRALMAALPAMLAGLAKNASREDGAAALHRALQKDHDGGLLNGLDGFLGKVDPTPGDGILGHVFGARRGAIEHGIGRASGLQPAQAGKLMAMAAPVLMAMLGRQTRERSLDAGSLGRMLTEQHDVASRSAPQLEGLTRLLDADGDGSITDDLQGIGKGVLGKLFGGS